MNLFIKIFFLTLILLIALNILTKYVLGIENYPYYNFWWQPTRSTRNMSYDLRGDVPINHGYVGPWSANENLQPYKQSLWNISSYFPIQNKPLWMVS